SIDALRLAMAANPAPTTGPSESAATQLDPQTMGKDTFLKLLVAQLKYQNPMEPVDSSQFMAQTAQFTMVEKLQAMAAQTDALVAGEASQRAAGLLGRQVSYLDHDGVAQTGVVTGTRFGTDGPVLVIGKTEIPLGDVREVTLAPAASTPAPA
ncbi:MAG TPA: flagellar hook capping FlgD N-terminal domain-containing protein, partial [Acidimicrobiia bacterium]|nr:flagellar hook capping FlgD N-terminal domain-containing protein [Acidimicrobiia bacterium]